MGRRRVLLGSDDQRAEPSLAGQRVPEGAHEPAERVQQPGLQPGRCGARADSVDDRRPEQHAVRSGHVGPHHERRLRRSNGERRRRGRHRCGRVADLPTGVLRRDPGLVRHEFPLRPGRLGAIRRIHDPLHRQAEHDARYAPSRSERLLGQHRSERVDREEAARPDHLADRQARTPATTSPRRTRRSSSTRTRTARCSSGTSATTSTGT